MTMISNSNEYETQLARVLEIEGLLLLSRERGDNAPELVRRLLADKTADLAATFALKPCDAPAGEEADAKEEAAAAEFEQAGMAAAPKPCAMPHEVAPEAPKIPDVAPAPVVTVADTIARRKARHIAGAIALVDRFRFRHDLFNNSDEDMNRALEMIDSMADAEEAREFLLNDLCWDASTPSAIDFLKLVDTHFGK